MSLSSLHGSLFTYWRKHGPQQVTTVFPGMTLDTTGFNQWVELWVTSLNRVRTRDALPGIIELEVIAHCFQKKHNDLAAAGNLLDDVQETLTNQRIVIRNFTNPSVPVIGYLQLGEPQIRDLSRNPSASGEHQLTHHVVTCSGIAQFLTH